MTDTSNPVMQLKNKRVGLALASGFFGFYHHAGVLKALVSRGIEPSMVTGTSAGAIVAAMYAAGLNPEEVACRLLEVERKQFWDMQWPLSSDGFGLLSGVAFGALLSRILPVHSFEKCAIPSAMGVYNMENGRTEHLNSGSMISGVRASCAVPYLFKPVRVGDRCYWDEVLGDQCQGRAYWTTSHVYNSVQVWVIAFNDAGLGFFSSTGDTELRVRCVRDD